jgi:hypothetical protein
MFGGLVISVIILITLLVYESILFLSVKGLIIDEFLEEKMFMHMVREKEEVNEYVWMGRVSAN